MVTYHDPHAMLKERVTANEEAQLPILIVRIAAVLLWQRGSRLIAR